MYKSNKNSNTNASALIRIQQTRTVFVNKALQDQATSFNINQNLPVPNTNKDASLITQIDQGATTININELNVILAPFIPSEPTIPISSIFIFTWIIPANNLILNLPILASYGGGIINWGDGIIENFTNYTNHTYTIPGNYTISVFGNIIDWGSYTNRTNLLNISNWGPFRINNGGMFAGCSSLTITATDIPDTNQLTDMSSIFLNCISLISVPSINSWNTAAVTSMASMFQGATLFNQDVSLLNYSLVTSMVNMFTGATSFSSTNYSLLLIALNIQSVQNNIRLDAPSTYYNLNAIPDRANLILSTGSGGKGWTIVDNGLLPFISTWLTTTPNESITLPLQSNGTYNFTVDWGDGTSITTITANNSAKTHVYVTTGTYIVMIVGTCTGWRFNNTGSKSKIYNISQWSTFRLGNNGSYFYGCNNLTITATDNLDLTETTTLTTMFRNCTSITTIPYINMWDTSLVTNMSLMFNNATSFNQDISSMNFRSIIGSSPTNGMALMFTGATSFSSINYSLLLIALDNPNNKNDVRLDAPLTNYNFNAAYDRANLVLATIGGGKGWTINDAGPTVEILTSSWRTTTTNESITLPLTNSGTYNCIVNWGDNSLTVITSNSSAKTHIYAIAGTYTVTIEGICTGWSFNNSSSAPKILNISKWGGQFNLGNDGSYFYGCTNLTITATSILDLTGTTNLNYMFFDCSSITTIPSINSWTTSLVTNMISMFQGATLFNQVLSFNTAAVTTMASMFSGATIFNSALTFNTAAVTTMASMFQGATLFNQILSFNTAAVTTMASMFNGASAFNSVLTFTDTSKVTTMESMFNGASAFNIDISLFNYSLVTTMVNMFTGANVFSIENYSLLLIRLNNTTNKNNVILDAPTIKYYPTADTARANLVGTTGTGKSWTINDDGSSSLSFNTIWRTTGPIESITLPLINIGTYNFIINWGDGIINTITVNNSAKTHTYTTASTYIVTITGICTGWAFGGSGSGAEKLINIFNWGPLKPGNINGGFLNGCTNLTITATDILNLTGTTDLNNSFSRCDILTSIPSINSWNMSLVTNMKEMFSQSFIFNQALSFDTSSVTNMEYMFSFTNGFNSVLTFDTSSVTNMERMFFNATAYSTENYSLLLINLQSQGLSVNGLQSYVTFTYTFAKYNSSAVAARTYLTGTKLWSISDGGQA